MEIEIRPIQVHPLAFAGLVGVLAALTLHDIWPAPCPVVKAQAQAPTVPSAWGTQPNGFQGTILTNLPASGGVVGSIPVTNWAPSDSEKEVALCDKEVPILMNSHDIFEIFRAGELVKAMNCNIGKRIP